MKELLHEAPRWLSDIAARYQIETDDIRAVTIDVISRDEHIRPTELRITLDLHEPDLLASILEQAGVPQDLIPKRPLP